MPSRSNAIHTDTRLTNYAVGFAADNLNWVDAAFPTLTVQKQSDKFAVFGTETFRLREDKIGPRTDPWPEIDWEESNDTFYCQDHGLSHFVPDGQEAEYRAREERRGIRLVSNVIRRNMASALAAFVTDSANVTNAASGVNFTTTTLNIQDYFLGQANAIRIASGILPDTVIMGFDCAQAILANTVTRTQLQYWTNANLTGADLLTQLQNRVSAYLGLNCFIPTALYATSEEVSNEAATPATLADTWPAATFVLYYRGSAAGTNAAGAAMIEEGDPTAFTRFAFNGADGALAGIGGFRVRSDMAGHGGWHVRASYWYDFKTTFDNAALLGTGALS